MVAANLFKEGLETAKDFASPNLRKFIRVVTDYQDKMKRTLEEMRKINISLIGLAACKAEIYHLKKTPKLTHLHTNVIRIRSRG